MIKRGFDILVSLVAIALALPLFVFAAVWIKLDSTGPVLYRGVRVGRFGRPFCMLKFRTMVADAEKRGGSSTGDDDPRITRAGRLLRRLKLDELPQLLNVLRGEMSLVGPRPQVPWAVELYTPEQRRLLEVRPGITDYASLRFRNEGEILKGADDPDEAYLRLIAPEKIRLGLYYVDHHNLWVDLKILAATAAALVLRRDLIRFPEPSLAETASSEPEDHLTTKKRTAA